MQLKLKRVYEPADPGDGFRVLVDRLWPRGVSKERAAIDRWGKDVAPSAELRHAFHHEEMGWDAFAAAYGAELAGPARGALDALRGELGAHPVVTLVFANHDLVHNHALVLRDALEGTPP
ncbi:DUF488 domain-containing protein [Microbacterium fluvii]|uniref:DUF488 domain-containing protein n=1 Tax=Microbacterium fluvii TaxID=415215 RepID=A0ABW2HFK2_9MICO|nr:DUF488 family protein [Microbacterium fluvii]MCU4672932.1 DUF488 family protein [Microbacterium fluvii]